MISTITISLIAFLAIINYQGVIAETRQREAGEIVPMTAEHSASFSGDDNNFGAQLAINLDLDDGSSSVSYEPGAPAWLELTFDKVYCIKEVKLYGEPGPSVIATWTCTASPGGECPKCDDNGGICKSRTVTVSTSSDAASSAASLPSNPDCTNGDIVRLALTDPGVMLYVQEIVVLEEVLQCTLPATSENSQYEVAGATQGDGTNVPVGTAFTLVCDEGYALENTKTSVQTCTENLATSDISNECTPTRQDEHEKYSAGTQAWCNHVFVVITTLLSFYTA